MVVNLSRFVRVCLEAFYVIIIVRSQIEVHLSSTSTSLLQVCRKGQLYSEEKTHDTIVLSGDRADVIHAHLRFGQTLVSGCPDAAVACVCT